MIEELYEDALTKLGLTNAQAKVYLALTKLGKANIKNIANTAKTDRANLYRTMLQLQEIGLIEVILGKPNTFKALEIQETLQLLSCKKKAEYDEALNIIDKVKKMKISNHQSTESKEDSFQLTAANLGHPIITTKAFLRAQISHDGINEGTKFLKVFATMGKDDVFKKSLSKGVNFRYIFYCEKNDPKITFNKVTKTIELFKDMKGKFEIRFIHEQPEAIFAILDNNEVFMHTQLPNCTISPCLHSTNACLVGVMRKYFEELWSKADTPSQDSD